MGLFSKAVGFGKDQANEVRRDAIEGVTLLPRATIEGVRESIAKSKLMGEFDRIVSNWELIIWIGVGLAGVLIWYLLATFLPQFGWVGMALMAVFSVGYFRKDTRELARKLIREWLRGKSKAAAAPVGGPEISPELMRELAIVRIGRVKHRIAAWSDLDAATRRALSVTVMAAILDDLTIDGRMLVAGPQPPVTPVGEGAATEASPDPVAPAP